MPDQSTEANDHFDLIIVGSGSGNAIPPEMADWRIALIERGVFGGTCLNVGCIPSKMFVLPADVAESAKTGAKLGVDSSFNGVDWDGIRDRVFGRIDPIAAGGERYRKDECANIELIQGTASFVGDRTLTIESETGPAGRVITGERVLVASGARAVLPPIPGIDTVQTHTSDTVMRLDSLPNRLGIIGGGFIATELGHVFSGYGTEVTMFVRSGALLRKEDKDVSAAFTEVFSHRVNLRLNEVPSKIEKSGDSILLHTPGGQIEVDELLVASGRIPNSDLVKATDGGLVLHPDGRIVVDDEMATGAPGVWAIGDVANSYQLKHLANAEAKVAFQNMLHPEAPTTVDYRAVPHAVFSHPQVAAVGLTEQEALENGDSYVIGQREYAGTAYGWALEDRDSFAKVLVDPDSRQLIGAHIMGPQAATLIQPLIQAMQFGQSVDEVAEQVFYIHPALTEVVENALLDAIDKLD